MNKKKGLISSELTIPCHWDKGILAHIMLKSANSTRVKVSEIYGTLANEAIAHGRHVNAVPDITRNQAINFRSYVKQEYLIDFVYIINAPFKKDKLNREEKEYIDWIINCFKPEALTVASLTLIEYIKKTYPEMKIYVSTIAGIKNIDDLEKYLPFKPEKIIGHYDLNRNFKDIKELEDVCKQKNIQLEIMATESCLRGCSRRDAHYEYLAMKSKDIVFHTGCNAKKITNPYELLKSNFIRPEDLILYNKFGINKFKITGRSKPAEWLPETVSAYLDESYDGNLIRLLGIDPNLKFESWLFVDNKSLDGFLQNFPQDKGDSVENKYCNGWIIDLYQKGALRVDGVEYYVNEYGFLESNKSELKFERKK